MIIHTCSEYQWKIYTSDSFSLHFGTADMSIKRYLSIYDNEIFYEYAE